MSARKVRVEDPQAIALLRELRRRTGLSFRCRVLGHRRTPDRIHLYGVCGRCGWPFDRPLPAQLEIPERGWWPCCGHCAPDCRYGHSVGCSECASAAKGDPEATP